MSLPYDIRRCAQVRLWNLESSSASSVPYNALWRLDCFIGGRTPNMHDGVWERATRKLLLRTTNAFFSVQACIHLFVQYPPYTRAYNDNSTYIDAHISTQLQSRPNNFSGKQKQKKVLCSMLFFFHYSPASSLTRIFANISHFLDLQNSFFNSIFSLYIRFHWRFTIGSVIFIILRIRQLS